MLAAIASDEPFRTDLRFLALIHDSFKADVRPHERMVARQRPRHARAPLRRALHLRRAAAEHTRAARRALLDLAQPRQATTTTAAPAEAVARPGAVRPLRRARRRQRGEGPHIPVVVPPRARDRRTAPSTPSGRTATTEAGRRLRESVRDLAGTTSGRRERRDRARHRATSARCRPTGRSASDDGLRVVLQWHGHGSRRERDRARRRRHQRGARGTSHPRRSAGCRGPHLPHAPRH